MMGFLDLLSRKRATPEAAAAASLYATAVAQARDPHFYVALAVPDTIDGRFDLIVLHVHVLCRRLAREGEAGAVTAQALFDSMFRDMDRNLREMGVGDPSIPKRIRAMVQAYYGRVQAYEAALEAGGEVLTRALARNVFNAPAGEDCVMPERAAALAGYARRAIAAIDAAEASQLLAGRAAFPPVEPLAA